MNYYCFNKNKILKKKQKKSMAIVMVKKKLLNIMKQIKMF